VSQLVLIDLGLIGLEPTAQPDVRGGWLAAHRAWLVVITAALLLGTLGAAAAPGPPELSETRIVAGVGHDTRIIGDRLYVVTVDIADSGFGGRTVSAYRLPDAAALWHIPLSVPGGSIWIVAAQGTLLVGSDNEADPVTVALDTTTGRPLWRGIGLPIGAVGAGDLALLRRPAPGESWQAVGGRIMAAVDTRTGRVAWSYPLPEAAQEVFARSGARLTRSVVGAPSGRVEVRDLTTGELLVARQLLAPPPAGQMSRFETWLQLAGDLVFAGDPGGPATAYEVNTLTPRWTADVNLSRVTMSAACHPLMCAVGGDGGVRALDAATGTLRWSAQRLVSARAYGNALVGLAEGSDRSQPPVLQVVDPRTGYPIRNLAPWSLADSEPDAPPIAIRHDATTMQAWLGVVDVNLREVQPLGVVLNVVNGCDAGAGWVMCRHLDTSIGVWQYR
jgi:outer membrane protein assembly factor BamB